ncbi:MAG: alpha/beta fold hydrolase [Gemmatimonadota bacterium]|nr:alpha/beta fold hydrolase [Gemmatimonadota bacterium]
MPTARHRGLDLHYEVSGEGPAVLLGHSFFCSGDMWAPQVGPLAERHTVINVDARGHGASDRAPAGTTLDDMLGDMLAVLDHAGVERAVWAGLSMGGMVALRAALAAPERVDGLVLLDTDAGSEKMRLRIEYRTLSGLARLVGLRPALAQVTKLMFGATSHRARPELVAEWKRRFAEVDVPSIRNMLGAITGREDLLPRLGEVEVPALVIVGAEDLSLPPARSRRLAEALPRARYEEVPGAGHLSTLERPRAVTRLMLDFLEELDPGGRSGPRPGSGR